MKLPMCIDAHLHMAVEQHLPRPAFEPETVGAEHAERPLTIHGLVAHDGRSAHVDIGRCRMQLVAAVGIDRDRTAQSKTVAFGIEESAWGGCANPRSVLQRHVALYVP